ncbi:autorepressor SdpR family transcription factor [Amphibacillus indicireducens]|mgnify:CR=1 FL=1|uniref:Sporulation delaying system autorepressor SdpR n=1 Tax=Amphibacillus indicireducens TaxID=1076330 RepID=A0ABP7VM67_9BACI
MKDVFKALADPTRRKILTLLKDGDLTAGEISSHFEMSKSSISQHLNILKQAELVYDNKQGQFIYYTLNLTVFQELVSWTIDFIDKGEKEQ